MSDDFFKVNSSVKLEFNSDKNRWAREIPLKNTSSDKTVAYALRTKNPDLFLFKVHAAELSLDFDLGQK